MPRKQVMVFTFKRNSNSRRFESGGKKNHKGKIYIQLFYADINLDFLLYLTHILNSFLRVKEVLEFLEHLKSILVLRKVY